MDSQYISQVVVAEQTRERMREAERERLARQVREANHEHGTRRPAARQWLTGLLAAVRGAAQRPTANARKAPAEACLDAHQP